MLLFFGLVVLLLLGRFGLLKALGLLLLLLDALVMLARLGLRLLFVLLAVLLLLLRLFLLLVDCTLLLTNLDNSINFLLTSGLSTPNVAESSFADNCCSLWISRKILYRKLFCQTLACDKYSVFNSLDLYILQQKEAFG